MTADGQTGVTYTFDDEGRMIKATPSGGSYCYIYDGNGLRVAKIQGGTGNNCTNGTFTKLYWRSISGDSLTETDGTGSVTQNYSEYVFFAGRRIASRVTGSASANTALFYYFADQLGSTRTITTGSGKNNDGSSQIAGQLCYDQDYTPYGQEVFTTAQMSRLQTTACAPSYKFTGYERDSETGLDYAFARYYSSRLARFLSTDPLGGSVGDLQSHNAYAYTANNPLNLIDPSGMDYCSGNSPYAGWTPPINCYLGPGNGDPPPSTGPLPPPCTFSGDMNCLGNVGQPVDSTCPPEAGANCQGHTGSGSGASGPSWCPPGDACDPALNQEKLLKLNKCVKIAENQADKHLNGPITTTAVGAGFTLVIVGTAGATLPAFYAEAKAAETVGEMLWAGYHAADVTGRFSLFTLPGLATFGKGILDATDVLNRYDGAVAACQEKYGYPNVP